MGTMLMDEPEYLAYHDVDGRLKQIATSDIIEGWDLGQTMQVPIRGFPLADFLCLGPGDVWLLGVNFGGRLIDDILRGNDIRVMRISAAAAAQWLIASGQRLPDALKQYNALATDDGRQDAGIVRATEAPGESNSGKGTTAADRTWRSESDQTPGGLAAAGRADGRSPGRIPKHEAVKRLLDGIDAFTTGGKWGETKKSLAESAGVPWSSAMRHFNDEQRLKNAWADYERKGTYLR